MRITRVLIVMAGAAAMAAPIALADDSAEQRLANEFAPVVALQEQKKPCGTGEPYRPISVDVLFGNPEVTLHGPGNGYPIVKTAPTAADLFGKGDGYYLDFPGNPLDPRCTYEKLEEEWNGNRLPVVYAHVAKQRDHPGDLALQYWFYWLFNDFNNKHESDWEMIQLVFHSPDASAALALNPYEVAYSQHEGGERATWSASKLRKEGKHPIVYAAAGSHANYYSPAIWLGRSASEGFGCDDTSPPSIELSPAPIVVPTSVSSPSARFAWLGYRGRWGQKESSFNNGPTGPSTKEQWTKPLTWQEESQRDSSVQIPALHWMGPSVSSFFCGAVSFGSKTLTLTKQQPLVAAAILVGVLILVALILTRTRWRPVETEPIENRRSLGQIFRSALRLYRQHRRVFLSIGAIFLPIGLLFTAIEALLFEDLFGLIGLTGQRAGDGDAIGVSLGGLGALLAASIVGGASAVTLSQVAEGEKPRARDAYRAVLKRFSVLAWAVFRGWLFGLVLVLTIIGIPVVIERSVRWAFVPQVSMLEGSRTPLRSSARAMRGNWWRTFLLTSVMSLPVVTLALVIGTVFLFLVPEAPLYLIELISSFIFALAYPYIGIAMTLLYYDVAASRPAVEPSMEPAPVS